MVDSNSTVAWPNSLVGGGRSGKLVPKLPLKSAREHTGNKAGLMLPARGHALESQSQRAVDKTRLDHVVGSIESCAPRRTIIVDIGNWDTGET